MDRHVQVRLADIDASDLPAKLHLFH